MVRVDEQRLIGDLQYRFRYLTEFMGFDGADVEALHRLQTTLVPLVPDLVDAVYDKLKGYDATWRHFLPRQHGYEGKLPESLERLDVDHELIRYRKEHLGRYLSALVTRPYDDKFVEYLDMVGKIHTVKAGSKEIHVPLVQMNALLGFVADALLATVMSLGMERSAEMQAVRAVNKLLWLQNDLINRHYCGKF